MFNARYSLLAVFIFCLVDLSAASLCFAEQHKFSGVGSCSSSNCHGSSSPRSSSNILQNEYVTWFKHDKHAKAFENLGNSDSKIIAKHLGLGDPQKEALCLSCHATYSASNSSEAQKHYQDGVSCESCHGAASDWLSPHAEKGATHERNLNQGMLDLVSADSRAKVCSDCHFGNDQQYVSHRIMGAGHPRISFELDTYAAIEPWHWEVDEDYRKRKGDYLAARYWLSGQYELAKREVERILSEKRSKDGVFPELTMFYCYSCHHSLAAGQWKNADYSGAPGELRLSFSGLTMLRTAIGVKDSELLSKIDAALKDLHSGMRSGDLKPAAKSLLKLVSEDARKAAASYDFAPANLKKLLAALVDQSLEIGNLHYEEAEQFAMAFSAVTVSISPNKPLYKKEIDQVYKILKDPAGFQAEDFRKAAGELKARVQA